MTLTRFVAPPGFFVARPPVPCVYVKCVSGVWDVCPCALWCAANELSSKPTYLLFW